MPIPRRSQKVNTGKEEHPTFRAQKSRKITSSICVDAENEPKGLNPCADKEPKDIIREQSEQYPQRSCIGHTVKLSAKAQKAMSQATRHQNPPLTIRNAGVKKLIVHLTKILEDWDEETNVLAIHHEKEENSQLHLQQDLAKDDAEDPAVLLASTRVYTANAGDLDQFVCSIQFNIKEPETYARAMQGPNAAQWAKAMEEELDQLHKNETWTLVLKDDIEPGHRPLGGKWVSKIKRDVNGNVAWFKARCVVKGYLQQYGVDFNQTFAAVVKPMVFRVFFAIAIFYDLDIDQMDVKTAFLYGLIDQLIYVEIPKGTETEANQNMVCKTLKALYGLKQSPRLLYKRLSDFLLQKLGLLRINVDHSIFVIKTGLNGLIISTFVDDIKIMAPKDNGFIQCVKAKLAAAFSIVDMGPISFYLGLKVERDQIKRMIKLSQPAYIDKVFSRFHFDQANTVNTPIKETTLLQPRTEGQASAAERERYQSMTGSIMFSMVETRPDIAFATLIASQFAKNPGHQHTKAVKTILQYLKGSRG